jgi:HK97 family phage major capsid protein
MRDFAGFSGATGGTGLIGTDTLSLVEVLKKKLSLTGISTMSGLTGNISVPVQTGRIAVSQTGMTGAAEASKPEFTNKVLSPVKFTGNCVIGADLLAQCNDDVSAFVLNSLLAEISYKVEDYILGKVAEGAGNTVTYSGISAVKWQDILAMEAKLSAYELDNISFIMSAGSRASLKGIEKAQGTAQFICDGENRVNGYAVEVSGAVANDNIYFGDWSKVLMGEWNGLNVIVDPYTGADAGSVRIVANACIDAVLLNSEAMVLGKVQE